MEQKAWIIDVNMGYGHRRTSFPLRGIAIEGQTISANNYHGMPWLDRAIWEGSRKFYEFISNFKKIPIIGSAMFGLFNEFQKIHPLYPKHDMSRVNIFFSGTHWLIKMGWGKHLIEKCKNDPYAPFVTTFFIPAFMAENFNYPGEIYCIICDTDIARPWATLHPQKSRIKYFAPTLRVVDRLLTYGVPRANIYFTGYPLPLNNVGIGNNEILKEDLRHRLVNLDPQKTYFNKYKFLISGTVGELPGKPNHPLTILCSIGGAGAQKEETITIIKKMKPELESKEMKIILSAGSKEHVKNYFFSEIRKMKMGHLIGTSIEILYEKEVFSYFEKFNEALRKTDILLTKPSELSFYAGLAIPILMLPTIGYQEDFNRDWLLKNGLGIEPENIMYIDQWLPDYLKAGYFADIAMQGFIECEQMGAFKIRDIIFNNH